MEFENLMRKIIEFNFFAKSMKNQGILNKNYEFFTHFVEILQNP